MNSQKPSGKKDHWEDIYRTRDHKQVGWYQALPEISLQLLEKIHARPEQSLIDVGCGVSTLVDHLIAKGFKKITLLDLSEQALATIKDRLADRADIPVYLSLDVGRDELGGQYDIWHDRAVFHFLTEASGRQRYMESLGKTLAPDGHAIIGTFSLDGPNACSGLDVVQYDEEKMRGELPAGLEIIDTLIHVHIMPSGGEQEYMYFIIRHKAG